MVQVSRGVVGGLQELGQHAGAVAAPGLAGPHTDLGKVDESYALGNSALLDALGHVAVVEEGHYVGNVLEHIVSQLVVECLPLALDELVEVPGGHDDLGVGHHLLDKSLEVGEQL